MLYFDMLKFYLENWRRYCGVESIKHLPLLLKDVHDTLKRDSESYIFKDPRPLVDALDMNLRQCCKNVLVNTTDTSTMNDLKRAVVMSEVILYILGEQNIYHQFKERWQMISLLIEDRIYELHAFQRQQETGKKPRIV